MITGASGLLGANLTLESIAHGYSTIACYGTQPAEFQEAECVPLALTAPEAVHDLIMRCRPDVIVHCAAETRVDYCEEHPSVAESVNVGGTGAIAAMSAQSGAKLIYVSTDSVFDGHAGWYAEEDETGPLNVYATTKLAGEEAVRREVANHLIIRTNIFGWNMQTRLSLAEWILDRLQQNLTAPGFTDIVFSPILVNDLAQIIFQAEERGLTGTYHVGASNRVTKFAFARLVASAFDFDPGRIAPSISSCSGLRASRPLNTSLSTQRISRALGRTMPSVEEGVLSLRRLRDMGHLLKLKSALLSRA